MTERFDKTYCSQCGKDLGPGDAGVSSCCDHGACPIKARGENDCPTCNRESAYVMVPVDAPDSLRGLLCGYGADLSGMDARDRAVILKRGAERWAEILGWAGASSPPPATALLDALEDLYANVRGECSWLLDDTRGGSDGLAMKVKDAIAAARTSGVADPQPLKRKPEGA